MLIANHLVISAQVTLRNWLSLLAEIMVVLPIRVVSIHIVIHDTNADLPIPRPLDTAMRKVSNTTSLISLLLLILPDKE